MSGEAAQAADATTNITCSRGLAGWLAANNVSLAFTSYQTGQLFLVGVQQGGVISVNQIGFTRAMGLWADQQRIYLAALAQIWRLENMLRPGEKANQHFDRCYVPRNAQTTGDVDAHELAVQPNGRVIFVNTSYSCLAEFDLTHSFRPLWKPPFISKLAPEDRCHLNGLAMADGAPAYVTAVSESDVADGWRDRRTGGGIVIDVRSGATVGRGLSMPHSPRVHDGKLYLLDSGTGRFGVLDSSSGVFEEIAFCPGYLRGLAFHGNFAIVGLSQPRETTRTFTGLPLDEALARRNADPICALMVIDLKSGAAVHWLKMEGILHELYDVIALPGIRRPQAIGLKTDEIRRILTIES